MRRTRPGRESAKGPTIAVLAHAVRPIIIELADCAALRETHGTGIASASTPPKPAATYEGVFVSTDGGRHWSATGLKSQAAALATNPSDSGSLFTGTPKGVFRSANGGGTWTSMNKGLTNKEVAALVIDPVGSALRAGTGSGAFDLQLT